jgi:hypothetical protein
LIRDTRGNESTTDVALWITRFRDVLKAQGKTSYA